MSFAAELARVPASRAVATRQIVDSFIAAGVEIVDVRATVEDAPGSAFDRGTATEITVDVAGDLRYAYVRTARFGRFAVTVEVENDTADGAVRKATGR